MRHVLFLGRSVYDYLEATIVEGLKGLGYTVHGLTPSNYIEVEVSIDRISPIYSYIFTNSHSINLLLKNPQWIGAATTVFVDGSDDPFLNLTGVLRTSHYMKRELLNFPFTPGTIKPVSFGIESRYYESFPQRQNGWTSKAVDIFCVVSTHTNPARSSIISRILTVGKPMGLNIITESTGERAYDNTSKCAIPTPTYHKILSESKVGFSLFGAGQDCARFWEILASGALLISEKITLRRDFLPRSGVEALYFENPSELEGLIRWVFENPAKAEDIALAGYKWGLMYGRPTTIVSRTLGKFIKNRFMAGKVFFYIFVPFWVWAYNSRARLYLKWYRSVRPKIF